MYAIVLPGLAFFLFSILQFLTSIGLEELGEGVAIASPFIVGGLFSVMIYAGIGALITWQIRGAPIPPGERPHSKALLSYLADPISLRRYCDKYGVAQADVEAAVGAGKMRAYSERGIDFVEDQPPPPTLSTAKKA